MRPPNIIKLETVTSQTELTVDHLHESAIKAAEENFRKLGQCKPLFIFSSGNRIAWLEDEWDGWEEKYIHYRAFARLLLELKAQAYSFVSEAYVAKYSKEMDPDKATLPSLLSPDQRDEMLMITSFDRDGKSFWTHFLITPRKRGLPFLGPRIDVDMAVEYKSMSGAAFNFFKSENL